MMYMTRTYLGIHRTFIVFNHIIYTNFIFLYLSGKIKYAHFTCSNKIELEVRCGAKQKNKKKKNTEDVIT